MKAIIEKSILKGEVNAPVSKSIAHRILIAAALSGHLGDAISELEAFSGKSIDCLADDIKATAECLKRMCTAEEKCGKDGTEELRLNARGSASTLRFLLPAALCLHGSVAFDMNGSLAARPIDAYKTALAEKGVSLESSVCDGGEHRGELRASGRLEAGRYVISGRESSQFISGMLFAMPLMGGQSEIAVEGRAVSRPYITMTLEILKRFGVSIRERMTADGTVFTFEGGAYEYPHAGSAETADGTKLGFEGDSSNAAYIEAFNLTGSELRVNKAADSGLQGDSIYGSLFKLIESANEKGNGAETAPIDITDCPDLGPVLFTLAALLGGGRFRGTERLRIKESDRVGAMISELAKFGASITTEEFTDREAPCGRYEVVTVHGGGMHGPSGELSAHGDHRIAMALTLAAAAFGGVIDGFEAVEKSDPDFAERLKACGLKIVLK